MSTIQEDIKKLFSEEDKQILAIKKAYEEARDSLRWVCMPQSIDAYNTKLARDLYKLGVRVIDTNPKMSSKQKDNKDPLEEDCRKIYRAVCLNSCFMDIETLNDAKGYWKMFSGDQGWKEVNDESIDAFLDYLDYLMTNE